MGEAKRRKLHDPKLGSLPSLLDWGGTMSNGYVFDLGTQHQKGFKEFGCNQPILFCITGFESWPRHLILPDPEGCQVILSAPTKWMCSIIFEGISVHGFTQGLLENKDRPLRFAAKLNPSHRWRCKDRQVVTPYRAMLKKALPSLDNAPSVRMVIEGGNVFTFLSVLASTPTPPTSTP